MFIRSLLLATALVPWSWVQAATATDPIGHWEGAIRAPSGDVEVAVDLARENGKLVGTFSNPAERINGYPLWSAVADGPAITLTLKTGGPGVQTFSGRLSNDGATLSGDFLISVYSVPFSLARAGEPKIAAPPRSPAVGDALKGAWSGSLDVGGQALHVDLRLTNDPDGTALGTWASEGSPATPLTIVQRGASVELVSTVTPAVYSGTLNADGTEISGTFKEGAITQALTFKRGK